ncbi:hypothetical protein GGX14DRAFT_387651 [Mycena pura]|uniref:Secreted protein n=1 Tax=Mycena pura TaxID=153505 RepID=A0AAD7E176_9AGAR|nr:hypothetical protein GGX14DRAFT_387651 [Mycena pura]
MAHGIGRVIYLGLFCWGGGTLATEHWKETASAQDRWRCGHGRVKRLRDTKFTEDVPMGGTRVRAPVAYHVRRHCNSWRQFTFWWPWHQFMFWQVLEPPDTPVVPEWPE